MRPTPSCPGQDTARTFASIPIRLTFPLRRSRFGWRARIADAETQRGRRLGAAGRARARGDGLTEAPNQSILTFSAHARREAWFLPTVAEQWLSPPFTAARPCAAGRSGLVRSVLTSSRSRRRCTVWARLGTTLPGCAQRAEWVRGEPGSRRGLQPRRPP